MEKRLSPVQLENYKPLREIVLEALKDAIVNGKLKPGERLMEQQVAEELGVSRTPVREAIRKLEIEGFVIIIPRRGAYVSDISLKDIAQVFEVRAAMEALAAGLAAQRIADDQLEKLERKLVEVKNAVDNSDLDNIIQYDTDFHEIIYGASRNDRLVQILNNLREQIQRYRTASLASPGRLKDTLKEHQELVDAISTRNVALAQKLAKEHIENAENSILEAFKERSYFPFKDEI
ncbi:GntR family transcriptional regulator [Desulfitibacter alkalitolerans]|uniref:GntR family transcriptional regulator n=1 Tax=Desulfitibacter alkalitolerans TaxID=264641 RepID=UPI00048795B4|nr:GntR family transcriptional regulator [Desulfitibacter alkalitolerans]